MRRDRDLTFVEDRGHSVSFQHGINITRSGPDAKKDPDDTLNPQRWAELRFDPVQPPTYRRLSQDPAVALEQLYLGRGSARSATDL